MRDRTVLKGRRQNVNEMKKAASGEGNTESRKTEKFMARTFSGNNYNTEHRMQQDIFQTVKEQIPMAEAVRFYGFEPNRAGFICCPFHGERTASLKIYADSFHCFGCSEHGTVIDFTAKLFNLDPLAAAQRLASDFGLQLGIVEVNSDQLRQRQKERSARELFRIWRDQMLNQLDACIRIANLADLEKLSEPERIAVLWKETLEAWADTLLHGDLDEQMKLFRDRGGVDRRCRQILVNTQMRSAAA